MMSMAIRKTVPRRGMPKIFAGSRGIGRGRGHRRPWTASTLPMLPALLAISFLVDATSARPMQIMRLDADQMGEILRRLQTQEREAKAIHVEKDEADSAEDGRKLLPLLFETNAEKSEEEDEPVKMPKREEASEWRPINLSSPMYMLDLKEGKSQCQMKSAEEKHLKKQLQHFLHSQLQHIWSDQFAVQVLGMNVSVHSIWARHVRVPQLHLRPICLPKNPPQLAISIHGGALQLRAKYRSVYRTVRTGHLRVRLGHFHGKLSPEANGLLECANAGVSRLGVHLKPRLLEEVDEAVAEHLRAGVQHLICNRLHHFMLKIIPKMSAE